MFSFFKTLIVHQKKVRYRRYCCVYCVLWYTTVLPEYHWSSGCTACTGCTVRASASQREPATLCTLYHTTADSSNAVLVLVHTTQYHSGLCHPAVLSWSAKFKRRFRKRGKPVSLIVSIKRQQFSFMKFLTSAGVLLCYYLQFKDSIYILQD